MITRTDILAHLERGMRVGFLAGLKAYTPLRKDFVRENTSDGAFEIYGDMGALPWPRQNGGQSSATTDARTGAPQTGGVHEGGPITILGGNERALVAFNQDWNVPIGIWHNAIDDNRVGGIEQWAQSAGVRFEQHMDFLCFDALGQGTTNTYGNAYDAQTFFSASHADPGAEYTTAQSNTNNLALSMDNFETVRVAGAKFRDDRGQPASPNHTLLIHAVDLERTAAQITSNPTDYTTANRASNPYNGKIQSLSAPGAWLSSAQWFVVDPSMPNKPVILQIRQQPQLVYWDDHTQGNGIRYYKWVARYVVTYGDWRLAVKGN